MATVKRKLKLKIWENAQWKCHYCGCTMLDPLYCHPGHFHKATVDHVVPMAYGGRTKDNLVPACAYCNERKGDARHVL